jgi:RNA polymerase primary sigma factor
MKDSTNYRSLLLEVEEATPGYDPDLTSGWKEIPDRDEVSDTTQLDEKEPAEAHVRENPRELAYTSSDVGFFLSLAGRFPLLTAKRERELANNLWRARRRIVRAIELARHSNRGKRLEVPKGRAYTTRRVSPEARRRLIAAEDYAERLLRLFQDTPIRGERFDRSLSLLPPAAVGKKHKKRWLGSWTPPTLTRRQLLTAIPVLREEVETIRAVREELVQHNLRLVVWVAKSYRGRGLDLVDLIQEGSMGLLRAIDRFDPAVGTRFSTFATHWVRQGISRALAERGRPIRIPLNRLPEVREAAVTQSKLSKKLDRAPSIEEIAAGMDVPREKVEELLPALTSLTSIDAPIGSGDISHAEMLADEESPSPLDTAIEEEVKDSVHEVLDHLPARHRVILAMRYGIGYPRECTLEEIGETLGLSRERIRQIEKVARESFRNSWNGKGQTA